MCELEKLPTSKPDVYKHSGKFCVLSWMSEPEGGRGMTAVTATSRSAYHSPRPDIAEAVEKEIRKRFSSDSNGGRA